MLSRTTGPAETAAGQSIEPSHQTGSTRSRDRRPGLQSLDTAPCRGVAYHVTAPPGHSRPAPRQEGTLAPCSRDPCTRPLSGVPPPCAGCADASPPPPACSARRTAAPASWWSNPKATRPSAPSAATAGASTRRDVLAAGGRPTTARRLRNPRTCPMTRAHGRARPVIPVRPELPYRRPARARSSAGGNRGLPGRTCRARPAPGAAAHPR